MKTQLENIYNSAKSDIEKAQSIADIDDIRLKYLSRKGEFNSIKKGKTMIKDLDKLGLSDIKEIYHNLSYDELFAHEKANNEGYAMTLQTIQLSKAKELLNEFMRISKASDEDFEHDYSELIAETEQFIKNSEVVK